MKQRTPLPAAFGLALLALVTRECSSEGDAGSPAGAAGTGDAASGSGGSAAGQGGVGGAGALGGSGGASGSGGTSGCSPLGTLPPGVPEGWKDWAEYSCACRLYVPGPSAAPLPAVSWEPCPQPAPSNPTCRRVKTDWTTNSAIGLSGFPQFWFDAQSQHAYLQLSRINNEDDPNVRYKTVERVDGEVRNVFLQVNPANEGCEALTHSLSDGRFAFGMLGDNWSGPMLDTREGVVAGPIGTSAPVVIKQDMAPQSSSHWYVSDQWLLEGRIKTLAHTWDLKQTYTVHDPAQDPEGMPDHDPRVRGPAVFFEVGTAGYRGVMSWTQADGPRPLLRWYGDWTQGAGNFNTDGVDMVWTHGEGKAPDTTQEYPTRSIKTAPFTTDPAAVKSTEKRLRSDPGQLTTEAFGVGCGYAGRQIFSGVDGGSISADLLVVRLSDGVSWIVSAPPASSGMMFDRVLGFTCEEVFATAQFPDDVITIVRIELDSLGPGIPPD